jgi:GNAT superfamily N-acetyltransferase
VSPALMFRRAVGVGLERPATPEDLDAVKRHMDPLGQSWGAAVPPFARPEGLSRELEARGFEPAYAWMKFRRPCVPTPTPATGLSVRLMEGGDAQAFADIVGEAFGLPQDTRAWLAVLPGRPGWLCVGAFDGAQAVAAGAAYVQGEVAWLGLGATLPSHRSRGAQNALLALRIDMAAASGARLAVTETGERVPDKPSGSYRNILRAGFEEVYLRRHWLRTPPP